MHDNMRLMKQGGSVRKFFNIGNIKGLKQALDTDFANIKTQCQDWMQQLQTNGFYFFVRCLRFFSTL